MSTKGKEIIQLQDLKKLEISELNSVADDIRQFLITSISQTGGHIGANLGVIELTIALHYVFNSPYDRIIFDTGHQGYTHKLLTGRESLFPTLNSWGGMSRFLSRQESEHDIIDASHAGTSISLATGIAWSLKKRGSDQHVVAVIGDGTMVEGMAFEGLNFAASEEQKIVIVLNDNGMAIPPNVGGILNLTTGDDWQEKSKCYFEGLGIEYLSVPNGHDIKSLVVALNEAKCRYKTVLVHVKTEKGRGLPFAKYHPYKMHFSMPFDPISGKGSSPTVLGKTYASVAAGEIEQLMEEDNEIVVITPATPYASYIDNISKKYPDRVIDVGMAEQHAVGMACGIALEGKKPVLCFQTTFMQRAFDQLLHDVAFMNFPITILGVRSGFSGYDSPTHHGLFDITYLRSFPNMQIYYPADSQDMRNIISKRMNSPVGPMVILHPYETIADPEIVIGDYNPNGFSLLQEGEEGLILCLGNCLNTAQQITEKLKNNFKINFGLACVRSIKPLPISSLLQLFESNQRVITMEEGILAGGFGSLISEFILDHRIDASILRSGVLDCFVPPGSKEECSRYSGIDAEQILQKIFDFWPELKTNN